MSSEIKGLTNILSVVSQMLSLYQSDAIRIPTEYREKVLSVKKMLEDDPSGLVNTLLDFSIEAALTSYRIEVESDTDGLENILNNWLKDINLDLLGKIPTGLEPLSKEFFRERWKGSSNILLRTFWNEKDQLILPTYMFFVEGEDIVVKSKSDEVAVRLGEEKYFLRLGPNNDLPLPKEKNEEIFIQRPFESWGNLIPTPYLIKRGVYHNSEFLKCLSGKGENIVTKALEYLFIIKKGTEKLLLEGNVAYDKNDLDKIKDDLRDLISKKRSEPGFSAYATNFDTEISDYIPDYVKVINDAIYSPIEKRIIAGMGFVEVLEGIGNSTRRESIINPKPFIGEVNRGIGDFKILLTDIIKKIIEKNKQKHPKWMNTRIRVMSSPITAFIDDKFRTMIRSAYDRGVVSKRTLVEIGLDLDFDLEVERRVKEKDEGLEELCYPPVIQNLELNEDETTNKAPKKNDKETLDDRKSIEKKNFNQSNIPAKCRYCEESFDYSKTVELSAGIIECPVCGEELAQDDIEFSNVVFEQAPYKTNKDLPESVKDLPAQAKTIFRKSFNAAFSTYNSEETAFKIAWSAVKKVFTKKDDKWVKKEKGNIDIARIIEDCILENK